MIRHETVGKNCKLAGDCGLRNLLKRVSNDRWIREDLTALMDSKRQ
jgi:hypothetical protein